MRRREFIAALGGAATWPLVARAQERMRRIAYLGGIADTAEGRGRLAAFIQALQGFGWVEGCNIQIEARWGEADPNIIRKHATESHLTLSWPPAVCRLRICSQQP